MKIDIFNMSKVGEALMTWKNTSKEDKKKIKARGFRHTEPIYIVFGVSSVDWKNIYSKSSYCFMGKEGDKVMVGTIMAKKRYDERTLPLDVREMTDEDMRQYQLWAEATNNYPRPLKNESEN